LIHNAKNGIVQIGTEVSIEKTYGYTTRAKVTVKFHRNISVDQYGTDISENSTISSNVLTFVEFTPEAGVFGLVSRKQPSQMTIIG